MSVVLLGRVLRPVLVFCAFLLLLEVAYRAGVYAVTALYGLGMPPLVARFGAALILFASAISPIVALERMRPGARPFRGYVAGSKFWLLSIIVGVLCAEATTRIAASLGISPLLTWATSGGDNGSLLRVPMQIVAIMLSIAAYDLFYYLFHRAQHSVGWLWRFHRVHHSITDLNSVNCYHHAFEDLLRLPFITLPMMFLVRIDAGQLVLLTAFVSAWGYYIHANTRLHFGWVGDHMFGDNLYHAIHHSREERHHDRNFAAFFPIWDRLFGTWCRPERDAPPTPGLIDEPPPQTVVAYLSMPFRTRPASTTPDRDAQGVAGGGQDDLRGEPLLAGPDG